MKLFYWVQKEKPSGDDGTEDFDAEMAATMGFGGFGSSKKWIGFSQIL